MAKRRSDDSLNAPSVRVYTDITPAYIRSAERSAESGHLYLAATLCDWLLTDDRVTAALGARIDALLGLNPLFEASEKGRGEQIAEAMGNDGDYYAAFPEAELNQMLGWGLLLGLAPMRHHWFESKSHGGRFLPMPRFWHPQSVRWDWQKREWSARDDRNRDVTITPGDGAWVLHTPFGPQRPWAYGLWRSLSRWVLLKQYAMGDLGRHSEKNSLYVATAPDTATREQRRDLAADLQNIGADTAVALANGFDMKLLEVRGTADIYAQQIAMADTAIAIRIRGNNLTTEVKGGSRAAAETQARLGDDAKLRFDAQTLSTTLHDQSLAYWAEYNYGDRALAPWPIYPVEPEEDKSQRASMVKTLGEGLTIFDKLGFDIDASTVTEEFGLSFLTGRSRERAPDLVPPGQGGAGTDDPQQPPPDEPPPNEAGKSAKALASGMLMAKARGFENGQGYVDSLTDEAIKSGATMLEQDLDRVLALVDSIKSYDELEEKLAALYSDLDPQRLAEVTERFLIVADLAGRAAVMEDV